MPILSLWANKSGISSTRSVVTVNASVMPTAYRIFKILSPFDRTMRYGYCPIGLCQLPGKSQPSRRKLLHNEKKLIFLNKDVCTTGFVAGRLLDRNLLFR